MKKKQLKYMYIVHTWISVPPKKTVIFEIQLKKSKKYVFKWSIGNGVIETCTCVFGFQGKPCLKFSWMICLIF